MKTVHRIDSLPRALPHQPAPANPAVSLRFWTIALCLTGGVMVLTFVAGIVILRNQLEIAARSVTPSVEPEAAALPPIDLPPAPLPVLPARTPKMELDIATKIMTPKVEVAVAPKAADADAAKLLAVSGQRDKLVETIGSLSGVHLYQSYLNIGLLADAVDNETYTKAEGAEILNTIGELLSAVDNQFHKLAAVGLDGDDAQSLDRVRRVAQMLRSQTTNLLAHWATGESLHIQRYQELRTRTWTELKEMLGLTEETK